MFLLMSMFVHKENVTFQIGLYSNCFHFQALIYNIILDKLKVLKICLFKKNHAVWLSMALSGKLHDNYCSIVCMPISYF